MPLSFYLVMLSLLPGSKGDAALPRGAQPVPPVVESHGTGTAGAGAAAAAGPAREALREGGYPWYDSAADRVRPVWAARMSWIKWLGDRLRNLLDAIGRFFARLGIGSMPSTGVRSDSLGTILLATVLATFFVFLIMLWLRRQPFAGAGSKAGQARPGTGALLAQLPRELLSGLDDPWAEAQRRRLSGDMAGAVIYLFAHQLLSLDRLGLIRLAPGWTGRHYARWLRDPVLGESLGATLGLFEEIYYGHRLPSAAAFEQVWNRAQVFEERRGVLEHSP